MAIERKPAKAVLELTAIPLVRGSKAPIDVLKSDPALTLISVPTNLS